MVGSPIVLVNRTGDILNFTADGIHYSLTPGDNYGFVEPHAYFAMAQNPLMGSEDYYTLDFQSLVGVKGDPLRPDTPYSDEELLAAMDNIERWDREKSGLRPGIRVKGRNLPRGRSGGVVTGANENVFAIGGN